MTALRVLLVCLAMVSAVGYSPYGFPSRHPGFGPYGHVGHLRGPSMWAAEEQLRPPCPKYRPIELGEWKEVITPHGGAYELQVALPGVRPQDREVELTADGRGVHIVGARQVPSRGHFRALECLPRDARLSRDGRFEILEALMRLPRGADATRATVQHGRQGLEILVPRAPPAEPPRQSYPPRQTGPLHPPSVPEKPEQKVEVPSPRTDGIEIEDQEYQYPEKDPDASEGWMNNRNEFQMY
mmetsp:Transcript_17556/g.33021  ORF Transcript_17556/g.33021 Transcript_17556/m.33021 type:complete len:241 (+) Transcript_17556:68-790(+)